MPGSKIPLQVDKDGHAVLRPASPGYTVLIQLIVLSLQEGRAKLLTPHTGHDDTRTAPLQYQPPGHA